MIRAVKPYMSSSSLVMVYYSLFHTTLSYGIIFWGQSTNSNKLFMLQKRVVQVMKSQFIFSILLFVLIIVYLLLIMTDIIYRLDTKIIYIHPLPP
jgi:hypothetical protein